MPSAISGGGAAPQVRDPGEEGPLQTLIRELNHVHYRLLLSVPTPSAAVAKEHLQIIVARERSLRKVPDFLPRLQKELLDVLPSM
jgi:hypothetical protein